MRVGRPASWGAVAFSMLVGSAHAADASRTQLRGAVAEVAAMLAPVTGIDGGTFHRPRHGSLLRRAAPIASALWRSIDRIAVPLLARPAAAGQAASSRIARYWSLFDLEAVDELDGAREPPIVSYRLSVLHTQGLAGAWAAQWEQELPCTRWTLPSGVSVALLTEPAADAGPGDWFLRLQVDVVLRAPR